MPKTYKIISRSLQQHEVWNEYNQTIFTGPNRESCEEYIKKQKKTERETRLLNKEFEINTISREDLIEYIGKEQALKLNNNQMKNIAKKMGEYHMYSYWDDLTDILRGLDIKLLENYEE